MKSLAPMALGIIILAGAGWGGVWISSREIVVSLTCGQVEKTPEKVLITHCDERQWEVNGTNTTRVRVLNGEGAVKGVLDGRHGEGPIEVR